MITYLRIVSFSAVIALSLVLTSLASIVSTGDYNKDFKVVWSPDRVHTSGLTRTLTLDKDSGSGFASKDKFIFGQFDMQIQLVHGYSAGTVVTFYLQSDQNNQDEIDFEFLGNISGQPYGLQTNVFVNGVGNREQIIYLWFDPTKGFHRYTIFWNIYQIVFKVNDVPIRTYRNHADKGVPYPMWQPMNLFATIWNGDFWATRGGRDKIDWSKAPFVATYRKYSIDACIWSGDAKVCGENSSSNWWNKVNYSTLTSRERSYLKWVEKNYLIYDYCQDKEKFHGSLPQECSYPKY